MSARPAFGLAVLLALASPQAAALSASELFEQRSPSVFVVHTYDGAGRKLGTGSGVVVGPQAVMTNCHVLAKASRVDVSHLNMTLSATLEFPDPDRDLCQLKVPSLEAPAVPLASSAEVRIGQRVYGIGAPRGFELTLSEGLVSSLRELERGKAPLVQTTAAISHGSSGGALFDERGRLVGITTFGWRGGQQLNFAVPVDWVREVPERGRALLAKRKLGAEARAATNLPEEMPQKGDTWTYALVDVYRPAERSRKYVHTVREVNASAIVEVITLQGAQVGEATFTAEPIAVYRGRPDLVEVAPYITAFRKLLPGEQWETLAVRRIEAAKEPRAAPYSFHSAHVVGMERVQVPAGTFEAMRVDLEGRVSRRHLNARSGHDERTVARRPRNAFRDAAFRQSVWYAPQVKRIVRLLMEADGFAVAYELESYSLNGDRPHLK
jgi:hypothetical protein